jgi:hypothetical protein
MFAHKGEMMPLIVEIELVVHCATTYGFLTFGTTDAALMQTTMVKMMWK